MDEEGFAGHFWARRKRRSTFPSPGIWARGHILPLSPHPPHDVGFANPFPWLSMEPRPKLQSAARVATAAPRTILIMLVGLPRPPAISNRSA